MDKQAPSQSFDSTVQKLFTVKPADLKQKMAEIKANRKPKSAK